MKFIKEIDTDLLYGSHPSVISGAKSKNPVAISILNTKKLKRNELTFVCDILLKYPDYIFFDIERIDLQNKYIFVKPYTTDEFFEIVD
jgi:hypothetical protein